MVLFKGVMQGYLFGIVSNITTLSVNKQVKSLSRSTIDVHLKGPQHPGDRFESTGSSELMFLREGVSAEASSGILRDKLIDFFQHQRGRFPMGNMMQPF